MLEKIILGAIQGVAEWLPVSSEGLLVLARIHLFENQLGLKEMFREALLFHLGTFLAALVYFQNEVFLLIKTAFTYRRAQLEKQNILQFLVITTLISGVIGLSFLKIIGSLEAQFRDTARAVTLMIGLLLLGTGGIQIKSKAGGKRTSVDLKIADGFLLGLAQGLAILPGFSRSGLTVSALLLQGFEKTHALKLSFLMSLPVVFAGNILLNIEYFSLNLDVLWGLLASFVLGIGTIHFLLKLAGKINFGYFVILFGILTTASVFI